MSPTEAEAPDAPTNSVADPGRLVVPRIGVSVALRPLGLTKERELAPPPYGRAGWWQDGPEPGERGSAVIAAHRDSRTGPDVFYRLSELRAGDRIRIDRIDGTTVAFVVSRVEQHPQDAFPTQRVYGRTARPEVRLITCAGDFDRTRGGYQDNLIVFGTLRS